ncbi:MAG: MOSC domain-containing protein [Pseudomonadota bacterium]
MSAALTDIFRHPIKSLGREALETVSLSPGSRLPYDRLWGVAHARARIDAPGWAHCANFLQCAREPALMAVTACLDERGRSVELTHPKARGFALTPDAVDDFSDFGAWLAEIWPENLPVPTGIHSFSGGLTDNKNPWISIHNHASHRAVEGRAGRDLSIHRWRGNLWINGLGPWQEFEWIGKEIEIGPARLRITDRIDRCKATHANPQTGVRDIDMTRVLSHWNHQDFGVFAEVVQGGTVRPGDQVVAPA